ncbi:MULTISPECIES: hypothetical protein [Streptomyces]|uniref:hypothetical protein n=1 Tax=Streptomyces TaxID=1883 RepID=UPI00142E3C71|nr:MULTISPECIES: hypothetical protein [Streptomyces]
MLSLRAAELAHTRSGEGSPATGQDVQHIVLREFGLLISITRARTALRERRTRHG